MRVQSRFNDTLAGMEVQSSQGCPYGSEIGIGLVEERRGSSPMRLLFPY